MFKANQKLELFISSLSSNGDGVSRATEDGPVIFVPNTVPGDRIQARITQVKKTFAKAELEEVISPSDHRIRPACIVADKCGGCQWLAADYPTQLSAKQDLVLQALKRIGKFDAPNLKEIIGAANPMAYRNKVSYPLELSADGERVKAGYFQRGTHKLINLNQCPTQDERFNTLLREMKQEIHELGWSIYDEQKHQGDLRHLCFRVGRQTGQLMATLVATHIELAGLYEATHQWLDQFDDLVSVNININPDKTNRIFGRKTKVIAGQDHIKEMFMGLKFLIKPTTFFQIFTEQAESIVSIMIEALNLSGTESVIDAYCGVGTLSLPIAAQVESVLGIEVQSDSIRQAKENARINQIRNTRFKVGKVEEILSEIHLSPDVLLLDPPRKGCDNAVIESIKRLRPSKIMYLSCNPATLARDLNLLVHQGPYQLNWIQPIDFFPQTAHVEALAFLEL